MASSKKNFVLIIVALLYMQLAFPQNVDNILHGRGEAYFCFKVHAKDDFLNLTKLISIDNVKGDSVWAYANMPGFIRFAKLGYTIKLLPNPSETATGLVMKDKIAYTPGLTWNFYPTYSGYDSVMTQFQSNYPNLCQISTIATLASGRKILVAKISDNVTVDEAEPEVLFTSSIHGDETTGYILMLHLIDYLLSNYGTNPEVTDMVNTMEIYINPLANPDGTYHGGNNSVSGATRFNANSIDLNRNYPDFVSGAHPDGNSYQPETQAFMDFASQHHFVESVNFHGGEEVVNYPWDNLAILNPDDSWWQYVSREYADTVHSNAVSGYMTYKNNGITNGHAWYAVSGGRQDYMNYYQHCREYTIELSDTKIVPASDLEMYWTYNWRSFILYMKEARYGIHGIITDQGTADPIAAKVFIVGHDSLGTEVYSSTGYGDYYRPIKAGTYTVQVSASCYQTKTISNVTISDHSSVALNIQMVPNAAVTTALASNIGLTYATSGGNVLCDGGGSITARGVCWSTTPNPTIANNHTIDGVGIGTFTSNITGLNYSTLYHVRAYATNSIGTVYGEDISFRTLCGAITNFPWTEGFENGGAIPACWTQELVSSSGPYWNFISGNGLGHPATAHSGNYNACIKDQSQTDNKTRLITPSLDLSAISNPTLTFYHTQAYWAGQDKLIVYYRTSATGTWIQLASYTTSVTSWTQRTIVLPNPTNDYYIAFEGNAKYGYGVCLDDVQVTCSTVPVEITIAASSNPVLAGTSVVFTATPTNGGTAPSFQWKVNGSILNGATNATFSYIPTNNDVVACVLTSSASCISGNPATSNTVTMTVNPIQLSVTPSNQTVSGQAGNTSFSIISNTSWTAISNQLWCTVTPSGTGNGTIAVAYSENTSGSQRNAIITIQATGHTPVTATINQQVQADKQLNLTVFLEGLFNGINMNKAKNATGDQFSGTIADQITVELHNALTPYSIAGGPYNTNVNTDGTVLITLPSSLSSNFYIAVKHRNSLETWSAIPISFNTPNINYNFTFADSQAYGHNLKQVFGKYVLFGGDVNQDGMIDSNDLIGVDNDASVFLKGYLNSDVNGDGKVDAADLIFLRDNVAMFAAKIVPQ